MFRMLSIRKHIEWAKGYFAEDLDTLGALVTCFAIPKFWLCLFIVASATSCVEILVICAADALDFWRVLLEGSWLSLGAWSWVISLVVFSALMGIIISKKLLPDKQWFWLIFVSPALLILVTWCILILYINK